jgi:hypothetical protein
VTSNSLCKTLTVGTADGRELAGQKFEGRLQEQVLCSVSILSLSLCLCRCLCLCCRRQCLGLCLIKQISKMVSVTALHAHRPFLSNMYPPPSSLSLALNEEEDTCQSPLPFLSNTLMESIMMHTMHAQRLLASILLLICIIESLMIHKIHAQLTHKLSH